ALCGMTAREAARLTDEALEGIAPDTGGHGYERWQRRLRDRLRDRASDRPERIDVPVRAGTAPVIITHSAARPALPRLRFVESPRAHVPGERLVTDVHLSAKTDPYLRDHRVDHIQHLPAVMSLE